MDPDKNWELGDDLTENDWDIISHSLNVDIQVNSSTRKYFKYDNTIFTVPMQIFISDKNVTGFYSNESNIRIPECNDFSTQPSTENETIEKYKEKFEFEKKKLKEEKAELEMRLEHEKKSAANDKKNQETLMKEFQKVGSERNKFHAMMNKMSNDINKDKEKFMEELKKAREDKEKFAKSFTNLIKAYNELMEKINSAISDVNEFNISKVKDAVKKLNDQVKSMEVQSCPEDMSDEFAKLERNCFNFKPDLLMNSSKALKPALKRDCDNNSYPQPSNRRMVYISYLLVR